METRTNMENFLKFIRYFLISLLASGFFIVSISNTTFASEIPRDGLVAEYLFDGNALDTSGNGNDGIVYGATPTIGKDGKINSAYHFDGTNVIQLPNILNTENDMTFNFSIKTSNIDTLRNRAVFEKTQGYYGGFGFGIEKNSGKLYFAEYNFDFSTISKNVSSVAINNNSWNEISVVKMGNSFRFYINGILDSSFTLNNFIHTQGNDVDISGEWSAGEEYLKGDLDNFRIYNRALSESEIQILAHEGEAPSCHDNIQNQNETGIDLGGVCQNVPRDGLVAEYLFDGNANDTSGYGNNGVISGASPSIDRFQQQNKAYFFRPYQDFIRVPNSNSLNPQNQITMSIWIKLEDHAYGPSGYPTIFRKNGSYLVEIGDVGTDILATLIWGAPLGLHAPEAISLHEWHHILAMYNGYEQSIYIDGIKKASNSYSGNIPYSSSDLYMGSWPGEYFPTGFIDDVRIYNRALSSSEVQALYNEGNEAVAPPTKPSQKIQSPELDPQDINPGEKIGKFQSGSGIILGANIDNPSGKNLRLDFEVYRLGSLFPVHSESTEFSYLLTHKIIVPYLGIGEYLWKVRTTDEGGNSSEWVDFGINNSYSADYGLYEGFEPYPYGYKFYNRKIADGVLYGLGFNLIFRQPPAFPLIIKEPTIIVGNKWDIFRNAFDISSLQNNERKMIDTFGALGLNETGALRRGSCYGMAVSSAMQYTHSGFISQYYPSFSNAIGAGTIWDNISPLSTDGTDEYSKWNSYSKTLETILSFQLSQRSVHVQKAITKGTKSPDEIIKELKDFPNKTYVLLFWGIDRNNKEVGHAVIPYKVVDEGDTKKIFIWDNNYQYPFRLFENGSKQKGYDQLIEVNSNGTWDAIQYDWKPFTKMSLVSLDDIYHGGSKSAPSSGLNVDDTSFILSGSSDISISDSLGRVSGFTSSGIVEEIPGVEVIVPLNATLDGTAEDDNLKQIYLPQKIDGLTIKISGKSDEAYDLMMAGGDYYTKISGVSTNSGQTDSYHISREQLQIDFDDNKTGSYSLMVDDFQNDGTGSIYRGDLKSVTNLQKFSIDWQKVITNNEESIKYEIDTNNDGMYDLESYYLSFPTSPDEKGSISGYVKGDTNASMAGWKICIDTNKNGTCEENKEPFQVTDKKGYYEFKDLDSKEYSIIEVPHQKWSIIKPSLGKYSVYLNNGQKIKNVNFENTFTKGKGK